MRYVVKTLDGKVMSGAYTPIVDIKQAVEYAKGMIFTAQLPDIRAMEIFSVEDGIETLVKEVG